MKLSGLIILSALFITACDSADQTANKKGGELYQKEIETLDQAKQLQQQLNEQAQQSQQRMDELNRQ